MQVFASAGTVGWTRSFQVWGCRAIFLFSSFQFYLHSAFCNKIVRKAETKSRNPQVGTVAGKNSVLRRTGREDKKNKERKIEKKMKRIYIIHI